MACKGSGVRVPSAPLPFRRGRLSRSVFGGSPGADRLMVRPHARAALRDFASTAARRTAAWRNDELSDASAIDLVIAAALAARGAEELHDARAFVQFLRA